VGVLYAQVYVGVYVCFFTHREGGCESEEGREGERERAREREMESCVDSDTHTATHCNAQCNTHTATRERVGVF